MTNCYNAVLSRLQKPMKKGREVRVLSNQPVPECDSNLRPDIVLINDTAKLLTIIDVTIPFENGLEAFKKAREARKENNKLKIIKSTLNVLTESQIESEYIVPNLMASVIVDNKPKGKVLLYIGTFGFSHMQYALTIGEWLVEDGFEVHLIVVKTRPNEIVSFPECFSKKYIIEPAKTNEKRLPKLLKKMTAGANSFFTSGLFLEMISTTKEGNRTFLAHPVMEEIKNEKYDMLVGEIFSPAVILKLRDMGIPKFIYISALPMHYIAAERMGLPSPSSYLPIMNECLLCGDEMGFLDRARNLYTALFIKLYLSPKIDKNEKDLLREMGYDADIAFIRAKQSYDLFVFNSNILLDYPRPTVHNVLHVGGSMTKEPQELEEPVASVFAKPSNGVILISFGTLAESSNFPKTFLPSIRAVMEALPSYEFIFRVGNTAEHTEVAKLPNVTHT
uniref:glucuronosyltransferase n=1 Tax=Panagrellus redivivus TaxID=6233 RepID=A0A7E4ZWS2_PANRE